MTFMFCGCSSLTSLDIHTEGNIFNVSKVTNMSKMLFGLAKLTELNMEGYNATQLTNIANLFGQRWDNMIGQSTSGVKINMKNFNAPKVTSVYQLFASNVSSKIKEIDMSGLYLPKVTNMTEMFYLCTGLTKLDLTGATINSAQNTSAVMNGMFQECKVLESIDLSVLYTANVTNMSSMFSGCLKLANIDISGFNTSNVTNMSSMFYKCTALSNLNLDSFDGSKVTTIQNMVANSGVVNLNFSNFNAPYLTNVLLFGNRMMPSTTQYITMNNWTVPLVTTVKDMFSPQYDANELKEIQLKNFKAVGLTNVSNMFGYNRSNVETIDLSGMDAPNITNMSSMFYNCRKLSNLNISGLTTANVTDMSNMFYYCSKLASIDLSGFDTSKVTNMYRIFYYCSILATVDISNFDFTNVTNANQFASNHTTTLRLDNIDSTMYDNTYFQTAINALTTSTATVYVKDSDCSTKLQGIKSTLNPVVVGA